MKPRRTLSERRRKERLCSEPGCEERAWPGSRYCAWHPDLRLAKPAPAATRRQPRPRGGDPWENPASAHERRPPLKPRLLS